MACHVGAMCEFISDNEPRIGTIVAFLIVRFGRNIDADTETTMFIQVRICRPLSSMNHDYTDGTYRVRKKSKYGPYAIVHIDMLSTLMCTVEDNRGSKSHINLVPVAKAYMD